MLVISQPPRKSSLRRFIPVVDLLEPRLLLTDSSPKPMPVHPPPPHHVVIFTRSGAVVIPEEDFSELADLFTNGELPLVTEERRALREEELREFLARSLETNNVEEPTDEASLREIPDDLPEDIPEGMKPKKELTGQFTSEELPPFICGTGIVK